MISKDMSKCYDCYVCDKHVGRPRRPGEPKYKGICKKCSQDPRNLSPAQRLYRERQARMNAESREYRRVAEERSRYGAQLVRSKRVKRRTRGRYR